MIRIIDGFEILDFDEGNRKGIFVIYKVKGKNYTQSKIYNVEKEKKEKLRTILEDYTKTNREAEEMCGTIGLCTILSKVYEIVSSQ